MANESDWFDIREDGSYPIGENGSWHGGIHLSPKPGHWIKPFFEGKTAGGKIQKEYYSADFFNEIDIQEYLCLPDNARRLYNEPDENNISRAKNTGNPAKLPFSTSYILLKNTIEIPLKKEAGKEQEKLPLDFYTLYMHLCPYNSYDRVLNSLEIPFYMQWKSIRIDKSSNLPVVKKVTIDTYTIYDQSAVEITEPANWYFPNFSIQNIASVKIKYKTSEEDPEIGRVQTTAIPISIDYFDKQIFNKDSIKLIPRNTQGIIPIYSSKMDDFSDTAKRENLLGNLKANADYTVSYRKNQDSADQFSQRNDLIKIIVTNKNIIENQPDGIIFEKPDAISNNDYTLKHKNGLYDIAADPDLNDYFCMPVSQYMVKYREKLREELLRSESNNLRRKNQSPFIATQYERPSNLSSDGQKELDRLTEDQERNIHTKSIAINETEYILGRNFMHPAGLPSMKQNNRPPYYFNVENYNNQVDIPNECIMIVYKNTIIDGRKLIIDSNIMGGEKPEVYKLMKKVILQQGQAVKGAGESVIPGFKTFMVHFNNGSEVYADIKKFKPESPLKGKITINGRSAQTERGVPCSDEEGYIRHLLKTDDAFQIIQGQLTDGAQLTIHQINAYGNKNSIRYIAYNNSLKLYGYAEIRNEVCQKPAEETPDVYLLKPGKVLHRSDLLGLAGNFDRINNLCHFELFFTDHAMADALFKGSHTYNRYKITETTNLYKAPEPHSVFIPAHAVWDTLADTGKYKKIKLNKIRIYFASDALDCNNQEPKINTKYRIKPNAVHAFVYNRRVDFAKMADNKRAAIPVPSFKEGMNRYINLLQEMIKTPEQEYLFTYTDTIGSEKRRGIVLDIDSLQDKKIITEQFTFWISKNDLDNEALFMPDETNSQYTVVSSEKAAADYTAYDYSPDKPVLLQDESQPIKELYLTDKGINEIRDHANELFYQFMHDKAVYYLKAADLDSIAENMLDFKQYFEKAEGDKDDDMYCDEEKINALCGEQVVFEVDPAVVIPHDIREALSRYVCKFPLEWNASLYTLCSKGNCVDCESPLQCDRFPRKMIAHGYDIRYAPLISAMMQKADVWNEAEVFKKIKDKKVWHFHPLRFKKHIDAMKLSLKAKEVFDFIYNAVNEKGLLGKKYDETGYVCTHFVIEALNLVGLNSSEYLPGWYRVVDSIDSLVMQGKLLMPQKDKNPPEGTYVFYKKYADGEKGHTGFVFFNEKNDSVILHNGYAGQDVQDCVNKYTPNSHNFNDFFSGDTLNAILYKQIQIGVD